MQSCRRLFIPGTTFPSLHEAILLHVGIRNVLDLLYNPFHLGVQSPDWRRMLVEKVLTLSGRGFGMFHHPTCRAAPATIVRCPLPAGRPPAGAGSAREINGFFHPEAIAGMDISGLDPWEQIEEHGSVDGIPAHVSVPVGSLHMRFTGPLRGGVMVVGPPKAMSVEAKEGRRVDQALPMLGDLLARWEQCDPGPFGIPLLSSEPLGVLPSYPHPAMVVDPSGHTVFRNQAAQAVGLIYGEEWGAFRGGRPTVGSVKKGGCRRDSPSLPIVLNREAGERYRIFRLPVERDDGLLTAFIGLPMVPMAPALPRRAEVMDAYGLSSREAEVALLLAQGLSTKAIARDLEVSWHTARGHVSRVLKKLDVSSRKLVVHRVLWGSS